MKKSTVPTRKPATVSLNICDELWCGINKKAIKDVPNLIKNERELVSSELTSHEAGVKIVSQGEQPGRELDAGPKMISSRCHWQGESFGVDYIL